MKYWRHHRIRGWRELAAFAALVLVTVSCSTVLLGFSLLRPPEQTLGVTFSSKYAQSLGEDPAGVFQAIVDELGVRDVRLPVYWSDVETSQGVYDFTALDSLMEFAASRNVRVTLVVGMKVPRWPECFTPEFYERTGSTFDGAVLRYVQTVVGHARQYSALTRWQVENEPLFPYGDCPAPSLDRLNKEVALVRLLDDRPVMMTVSGEQEPWLDLASTADTVGISLYRFAYNNVVGAVPFPYSPFYYRAHAFVTRFFTGDVIISELQMEPWFTGNPQDPASVDIPFTADDFVDHLAFAKQTGMHEALLWGAEWWYYQHIHGDDSLWNAAKAAFMKE
jgi:hypothetical protein